ncbi:protein TESPA1 isoform X2 [Pelodiscus sinensis]
MASSALSSGTNKTASSLSEILEWCQEDAEEILFNLGFVQDEPQAAARIPSRFFSAPSQAKGINFQLFLKAQVQRLEMEDPCLTLASRFQQVEALAATADAFFCLYSYVSKTPLQKISPAQVFWSCPEIPSTWVVPTKVEATSPVDRLKKAISKMCLYTSPKSESPHRASKAPSCQRSSLGRVVQEVLERAREERFQFAQTDIEGMEGADWEMPTGTVQCWYREQSSSQELSEPENNSPEHVCHGGETVPTPPGGQGERHTVPALRRLQWAPQGLPDGRGRACAEGLSNPGQKEKKGPGEAPLEVAPSKWEVPLDVSCPSRGAGSDEQGSQVGDTVAPWSYLIPSPGTHCEAGNARGTLGTMWLHLEPREGLRSEAGFALDLSRTLSWDNARPCVACLADPRGAPEKDGREDRREEEPRTDGKPHAPPTGSSRTCGSQDAVCPQVWDSKDSGPALLSSGEVPASWAAGGGSMLHGPRRTLTLPLQEDDSFEMEEVQSASEDEDGAPEADAWLPAPALPRHRRSFMLHAHSAQSDSSGFVEEPVPDLTPSTQLPGTAGSPLCRPMEGPCDTGQVSLAENSSEQQGDTSCLQVTHGFAAHPKPLLEL